MFITHETDSPAKCVPHPEHCAVTFVTIPELIRPSIPVMTHSLDQKVSYGQKGDGKKVHG
jgi:hypothetical protein